MPEPEELTNLIKSASSFIENNPSIVPSEVQSSTHGMKILKVVGCYRQKARKLVDLIFKKSLEKLSM